MVESEETGVMGNVTVTYKYGLSVDACNSTTVPAFKDADTYTVYFVATADNHNDVRGSFNVIINKKELTITAADKTITYGDAPLFTDFNCDGFVGTETILSLTGQLKLESAYQQFDDVGDSYVIEPSGLSSNNYEIIYVNGTLTVNPLEIGVEWTKPMNLIFDGTAKVPGATAVGLINGDTANVIIELNSGDNINVGAFTYKATGFDNKNYKLSGESISDIYTISADNKIQGTGDSSNIWIWIALCIVSGVSLIGIVLYQKRKKKENE